MKIQSDNCVEVRCDRHGFLARVIENAEVCCNLCERWIRAYSEEEKRQRQVRRSRNLRYRSKQGLPAIKSIESDLEPIE